jgi:hypothetical protein
MDAQANGDRTFQLATRHGPRVRLKNSQFGLDLIQTLSGMHAGNLRLCDILRRCTLVLLLSFLQSL